MSNEMVYPPVPPRIATLEANEVHLYTFSMYPVRKVRDGGVFLKITAYQAESVRFLLHLTDTRIIIESDSPPHIRNWIVKGLVVGIMVLIPYAAGGMTKAIETIQSGERVAQEQDRKYYYYPYSHIQSIESFRQGVALFIRMTMKIQPSDDIEFGVTSLSNKLNTIEAGKDFVKIVNELIRMSEEQK